jgi:hypothetical protein
MTNIDQILAYENGELDPDGVLELFAELIKSGMAWTLQGHYGRTAQSMIEAGHISREGEIL